MFGLLSALAVTAGLSASPSTNAPSATSTAHEPRSAPPAPSTSPGAALALATKSYLVASGQVAWSQLLVPPPIAVESATAADPGASVSGSGTPAASPSASDAAPAPGANAGTPATGAGAPSPTGSPTPAPSTTPSNNAASGPGGPGAADPTSGGTGDCNISVTDLTIALSVQCTTGDSGSAAGTGTGGDSGPVMGIPPGGSGSDNASGVGATGPDTAAPGAGVPGSVGATGAGSSAAIEGTKGNCLLTTTNAAAALSVSCSPGTVGSAEAGAAGGSPGPAGGSGGSGAPAGGAGSGGDASGAPPDLATSGDGGNATTRATSGRTGNCIIHLVNIRAALTVVCITGGSGGADGHSQGGRSGSATILAAGPGGVATSGGSSSVATSGSGGSAMAVISSGGTGSCVIFLVNVMASVSVLCITGNSGPASGTATGGSSGSALVLAATGSPGGASSAPSRAASGSGGRSSALVTSGATGSCAISLTNVWGSISVLCRTGNSGTAAGRAVGGDSGSAYVLLKAPSVASPVVAAAAGAQSHAGHPGRWGHGGRSPAWPGVVAHGVRPAGSTTLDSDTVAGSASPAVAQASVLPVTGAGTSVPLSLAAGLLLTGGLGVGAATRRRRPLRRD